MSLEEDIQQKAFKSDYHKLAVNILYTHGWLVSRMADVLRPFDLTVQQYNILRILRGQYPDPVCISTLRERMIDKMSDASRLVERLRSKGLVDRTASTKDRRKVGVVITEEGLRLLERAEGLDDLSVKLFAGISEADAGHVSAMLDALRGSD